MTIWILAGLFAAIMLGFITFALYAAKYPEDDKESSGYGSR